MPRRPRKPSTPSEPMPASHGVIGWEQALGLFEIHLRAKRAGVRTVTSYLADLEELARTLSNLAPGEVTLDVLRELQCALMSGSGSRSGRPLAAATVARIGAAWRAFFRFLADEGRIERDPGARLESPRVPKRAPLDVLTVREVERLLDAPEASSAKGLRDRALLDLLYSAGLRNAEAHALDLTDVDHVDRQVMVRAGKGEKGRIVPLTRSAYARLMAYLDRGRPAMAAKHRRSTEALFVSVRGRISTDSLGDVVQRARRRAGIKKAVTPHTLRRTFATTLLKNGVSVRHIQTLLGHANLSTTAIYLRIDQAELRRELLLRHPRERMGV